LRIRTSDIPRSPQLPALRGIEHTHGFLTERIDVKTRLVRTLLLEREPHVRHGSMALSICPTQAAVILSIAIE